MFPLRERISAIKKYFTWSVLFCVLVVPIFLWIRLLNRSGGGEVNGTINFGNSVRMKPLYSLFTSDYGPSLTITNPFCRFLSHCLHNRTVCFQEFDQVFEYENQTNCARETFAPLSVTLCFGPVSSTATVGYALGMEFGVRELKMIESVSCWAWYIFDKTIFGLRGVGKACDVCSSINMPISYSLPRKTRVTKSKSGRIIRKKKRTTKKSSKKSSKKNTVVRDSPKIFRA